MLRASSNKLQSPNTESNLTLISFANRVRNRPADLHGPREAPAVKATVNEAFPQAASHAVWRPK